MGAAIRMLGPLLQNLHISDSGYGEFKHDRLGTGIVEPGTFVEYQDGRVARLGLVRSTRIEAGFPEVWQTLGVECRA